MKIAFESEDCILGIIFGLLFIAESGRYFKAPWAHSILMIIIPIFAIFIVLDMINDLMNIGGHFMFIIANILHNVFDLALGVSIYAIAFSFTVPWQPLMQHLSNPNVLFYIGAFEVVSHIIWIILTPFID